MKKIGFVVYYPFQWFVHKNVFNELKEYAEVIIDLRPHSTRFAGSHLKSIEDLLKKNNVKYRILEYDDYGNHSYLESFFAEYSALVSLWESGCMRIKETSHLKKICLTYGSGKELTMVRKTRAVYDLILAYGDRDSKLFSLFTTTKIVGNPKFDDYFNNIFDEDLIKELNDKLDKKKKTLLYLPTHSDLCSIDVIAPELIKIKNKYNIIVKLHYYTVQEYPEFESLFIDNKIITYKDDTDLITLLKLTDIVLSDNSSAIFDAILADKKLLITNFLDQNFLDEEHKKIKILKRGIAGASTYSGSIENQIKQNKMVETLEDPADLESKLNGIFELDNYKESRMKVKEELFTYRDGKSAKRAAEEIMNLLNGKTVSTKGIMYHANLNTENLSSKFYSNNNSLIKENSMLRQQSFEILDLNNKRLIFVINSKNHDKSLEITIKSIEKLNLINYKIIVVNGTKNKKINLNIVQVKNFQEIKEEIYLEKEAKIFFLQRGTIITKNFVEKHLMLYSQYKNLVTITSRVNFFSIREINPNLVFFDKVLYNSHFEEFSINKKCTEISIFDALSIDANYFNLTSHSLNYKIDMFTGASLFKKNSNMCVHAYLNISIDNINNISDIEIFKYLFIIGYYDFFATNITRQFNFMSTSNFFFKLRAKFYYLLGFYYAIVMRKNFS